jgi:cyclophilin family peptidyl-prolyl cis-trans isomerase
LAVRPSAALSPTTASTALRWTDGYGECSLKILIGSLAMANAGPDTNGSQFFIISGPQGSQLPPSYSLFGKVVKGLDVVEQIQSVKTGSGDRPVEDVVIEKVTITEADD